MAAMRARDMEFLKQDETQPWSWTNLSDAQRLSLMAISIYLIVIPLLWRGIPYGRETRVKKNHEYFRCWKWFQILWPFKVLTVLFHEMSHAIVGTLEGGKVLYIRVDANQGGVTAFAPGRRGPGSLSLPAGYICAIGCGTLFAGFNTLASKVAMLILLAWIGVCLIFCAVTMPKLYVNHHRYLFMSRLARLFCMSDRAARYKQKAEGREGDKYKDKMVSLDIIICVTSLVLVLLIATWLFADSLALRFVILWLGMMSAVYAIWDVYDDGVRKGDVEGEKSDCSVMADVHNKKHPKKPHSVSYYALWWFSIQVVVFIATIIGGLYYFRQSTAEQALQSRKFLASPFHYGPADILSDTKGYATSAGNAWDDWSSSE